MRYLSKIWKRRAPSISHRSLMRKERERGGGGRRKTAKEKRSNDMPVPRDSHVRRD